MATQDKQRDDVAQAKEATRAEKAINDRDKSGGAAAKPAPRKAPHGGSTGRREFGRDG